MTAPATAPTSIDPRVEEWRDTVLALAASALQSIADGDELPDEQTLAVIANAADDIRVRDCYIWTIVQAHDAATLLSMTQLVAHAGLTMPQERCATLMTLTAIIEGLLGNIEIANAAIACAEAIDPDLFICYATKVSLQQMQHRFHMQFRAIFDSLSYADVRYGQQ